MAELNPQQRSAVYSTSPRILCLAGAGAGKTATMNERIKHLVEMRVDPRSILVLTFTNAAAFSMAERYKKLSVSGAMPEFKTFHGFCYSVLIRSKEVRAALGYTSVPGICDEADYKKMFTEAKLQCNTTLSDDMLKNGPGTVKLSDKKQFEYDLFQKALKRILTSKNVITFDLLSENVCGLFVKKDTSIKRFHDQYKYIFCDEMQDTDPVQVRFLNSFPADTQFFFVGDALQNIYSFRGCTNQFIKVLSTNPDWELIKLYKNYRSTRQICNFANNMSTYAKSEYRIEMEGQRDGDDVKVFYGSNTDYNNPVDSAHLRRVIKMVEEGDEEFAILCRTNKEVQYVCQALKDKGIDYTTSNKTNDDINVLNSAVNSAFAVNWLSTYLDNSKYADYIRNYSIIDENSIDIGLWFRQRYGSSSKVEPLIKKVDAVRKALAENTVGSDKFVAVTRCIKTKIKDVPNIDDTESNEAIVRLIIDNVEDIQEHRVYVGTIHSSKGLEYQHVILVGVNDAMFKLDCEDMLNLYYVGITRAQDHLTIFRR